MGCMFMALMGSDSKVEKKISDPNMTTKDNPLAEKRDPDVIVRKRNMKRLVQDAEKRGCPFNGHVYAAMMDTRYKED